MAQKPEKSDKRQQTSPLQIRMRAVEKTFLDEAAKKLSDQSPSPVGVGPFMRWAAIREAEKLLGVSFADYEERQQKRSKTR